MRDCLCAHPDRIASAQRRVIGWELVVRGRPLTVDGLLTAAARTLAEFSWKGEPLAAISGEITGSDRTTADLLSGPRLRTRRTYATVQVEELLEFGFEVIPTFATPHVSIVLPRYDCESVRSLLDRFGPEQTNPYFMRGTR